MTRAFLSHQYPYFYVSKPLRPPLTFTGGHSQHREAGRLGRLPLWRLQDGGHGWRGDAGAGLQLLRGGGVQRAEGQRRGRRALPVHGGRGLALLGHLAVSLAPDDPLIAEQLQVVGGEGQVRPRLLSQQSQGSQPEAGRGFEGGDGLQEEREGSLRQRVVFEGVRVSELGAAESFRRVQQSLLAAHEPGLASGGEEALDSVAVLEIVLGLETTF